ncbi:hypothetical protein GIB67_008673 [Kingdonia uniflora]|uniref:Pentatricopeptide repeat-containing protein n=1 Tax=Kingdonia uniflora TaxID=39325 RepID=A0A7J7M543_9MAGN|nr:hypothetical protein GIB67_008673 [Kingdonia uniflora]
MGNEIRMLKKMVGASSKDATLKTVALEFFYWVQESQDFKHSAVTYNAIVWVLGKEESIEKFWILVKEMKSLGYDIDLETYRKVAKEFFVNQFVRSNKLIKDAVDLYELMMDSTYKPPIEYCSKLLRKISLLETPDLSLVDRVIKKSNEVGDSFSKTEYDMVHRSFINAGKFNEAEKVLETMRNAGYAPDNFNTAKLCLDFLKQGKKLSGSVSEVVKLLVDHLCPNDKADIAYTFVVEMAEKTDFRPSPFTYETLIKKLLEEGKLEEAFNLLRMVINDSFQPILRPSLVTFLRRGQSIPPKSY